MKLVVVDSDDRSVEIAPPFCKRHKGRRLRRAWKKGSSDWRFYWCDECDVPDHKKKGVAT